MGPDGHLEDGGGRTGELRCSAPNAGGPYSVPWTSNGLNRL